MQIKLFGSYQADVDKKQFWVSGILPPVNPPHADQSSSHGETRLEQIRFVVADRVLLFSSVRQGDGSCLTRQENLPTFSTMGWVSKHLGWVLCGEFGVWRYWPHN